MTKQQKITYIEELIDAKFFFSLIKKNKNIDQNEIEPLIKMTSELIDLVIDSEYGKETELTKKLNDFTKLFKLFKSKF